MIRKRSIFVLLQDSATREALNDDPTSFMLVNEQAVGVPVRLTKRNQKIYAKVGRYFIRTFKFDEASFK